MSKRTADEAFEEDWKEPVKVPAPKVNSLDSDEEDEEEGDGKNYEILQEDDIEGQEEGAVGNEGDIQLTPFNMKEELEEGHFDTDGMYHWNKEKVVKDSWLENIDWVKINPDAKEKKTEEEKEDAEFLKPMFDDLEAYKKMLALMKPGETVAKTLRRLGGNKTLSASERWKKKKSGEAAGTSGDSAESQVKLNEMTDLSSNILTHTGNMDIYQESYELINAKIQSKTKEKSKVSLAVADDLDMYADDFDTKEKQKLNVDSDGKMDTEDNKNNTSDETSTEDGRKVKWEYKLKKEDEKIEGPFSTEEMQKWTENGKFTEEIFVRKYGSGGDFYTNKRIDFELYL